jgi:hypothetical protein
MADKTGDAFGDAKDSAGDMADKTGDAFGDAKDSAGDMLERAGDSSARGIDTAGDTADSATSGRFSEPINSVENAAEGFVDQDGSAGTREP